MSQDTRKDKRAKVVSLNVRYKSATVDEFIENHSHDVSKGGIFVKTPTPFPPGTLLKFEIRLAGDKSVISGVGRVVWKREPTQAGTDKPAGMGVKFIKIDDASRAVIDRLTSTKADAGSAYTSDPAALEDEKAASTASPGPTTMKGIVAAPPSEPSMSVGVSSSTLVSAPPVVEPAPAPAAAAAPAAAGTTKAMPAPPPSSASSDKAAAAARPNIGQKTLPLGSVAPLGLGMTPSSKTPSATATPASSAAPATTPAASAAPAGGPPAPIKLKPATAIGVAPPGIGSTTPATPSSTPAKKQPSPSRPDLGSAAPAPAPAPAPSSKPNPAAAASAAPRPMTAQQRKATMMGVAPAPNIPQAAPSRPASSPSFDMDDTQQFKQTPKAPPVETPAAPPATMADAFLGGADEKKRESEKKPAASPMFPTSSEPSEPVKEPTMMKQAAELLEEALKEAGGSMDEIGQNPLFAIANKAKEDDKKKDVAVATSAPGAEQSGDTMVMHKSPVASTPPPPPAAAAATGTAQTERQAHSPAAARSVPPPSSQQTPARSVPPPAQPVGASIREPEKKKSPMALIVGLLAVVLLAGIGVFVMQSMTNGGGDKPAPTNSTPANTASAPPANATPEAGTPATAVDSGATPAINPTPTPTPEEPKDAGGPAAAKDAGVKLATAPTPAPAPKPKLKPKPKPQPEPGAEPSPSPDPAPAPAPAPEPAPAPPPTATSPEL